MSWWFRLAAFAGQYARITNFQKVFTTDGTDGTDKGRQENGFAMQYKFPIREIREIRGSSPSVAACRAAPFAPFRGQSAVRNESWPQKCTKCTRRKP
jgi:hypothetical protein